MDLGSFLSGGAVGTLIGAVATHFLTKLRAKEDRATERFNTAAAEVRAAFADELALTRSSTLKPGAIYEALKKAFDKHDMARAKFREFVSPAERGAFDAAWRTYFHSAGADSAVTRQEAMSEHLLGQYHALTDEEEASARAAALSNIKSILNFARQQ